MELKAMLLETEADKLIELVKENPGITVEEAASMLNVPEKTVEIWAKVFAKEKFMILDYDARGRCHLYLSERIEEVGEQKVHEIDENIGRIAKSVRDELKARERRIKEFKKIMEKYEKILNKELEKSRTVEREIDDLKKQEEELRKELERVLKEEKELEREEKSIEEIIDKKAVVIREMEKEVNDFEKLRKELEKEVKILLKLSKILKKKGIREMGRITKEIDGQIIEIKKELKEVNEKYSRVKELFEKLK